MNSSLLIDISQLRIGMYVQLDVGWLHHPFPVSRFRIVSASQIATLRELGLSEVRYYPHKSDPALDAVVVKVPDVDDPELAADPVVPAVIADSIAA